MAEDLNDDSISPPRLDGTGVRVAIVVGRFNSAITTRLLAGARATLCTAGVADGDVTEVWVPGAFEIPLAAKVLASSGRHDAVICLGCVIRGETAHFEHVATQAASGIMRAGLDSGRPVVFGVLTTEDVAQALARSAAPNDGDVPARSHNAGADSAAVAIEMVALVRQHACG